jgi:hypothetical protein
MISGEKSDNLEEPKKDLFVLFRFKDPKSEIAGKSNEAHKLPTLPSTMTKMSSVMQDGNYSKKND